MLIFIVISNPYPDKCCLGSRAPRRAEARQRSWIWCRVVELRDAIVWSNIIFLDRSLFLHRHPARSSEPAKLSLKPGLCLCWLPSLRGTFSRTMTGIGTGLLLTFTAVWLSLASHCLIKHVTLKWQGTGLLCSTWLSSYHLLPALHLQDFSTSRSPCLRASRPPR